MILGFGRWQAPRTAFSLVTSDPSIEAALNPVKLPEGVLYRGCEFVGGSAI
jgi:hypothetical protein